MESSSLSHSYFQECCSGLDYLTRTSCSALIALLGLLERESGYCLFWMSFAVSRGRDLLSFGKLCLVSNEEPSLKTFLCLYLYTPYLLVSHHCIYVAGWSAAAEVLAPCPAYTERLCRVKIAVRPTSSEGQGTAPTAWRIDLRGSNSRSNFVRLDVASFTTAGRERNGREEREETNGRKGAHRSAVTIDAPLTRSQVIYFDESMSCCFILLLQSPKLFLAAGRIPAKRLSFPSIISIHICMGCNDAAVVSAWGLADR